MLRLILFCSLFFPYSHAALSSASKQPPFGTQMPSCIQDGGIAAPFQPESGCHKKDGLRPVALSLTPSIPLLCQGVRKKSPYYIVNT